jgi:DNA-binding IscR family transcriptional regulator
MSAARWVGQVGGGWTLIKDPREIRVADVYQLFVFRGGPRLAGRHGAIDSLAQALAAKLEGHMQMTLEELFSSEPAAAPAAAV